MNLDFKVGLVLSGGGARAAYQAGVLKGISDILGDKIEGQPFQIITGISAGAINAAYMASALESFSVQSYRLAQLWSDIIPEQVIRTDFRTLSKLSAGWMKDLGFGGVFGKSQSTHLLDSSPLLFFLKDKILFSQMHENILSKKILGVGITGTSYATGTAVTFFDSLESSEWTRSSRIGQKSIIGLEHILASSSIPILFKPVKVGGCFFGDGGIRSNAPFSPAIHLGADRILAIGVRHERSNIEVRELNREIIMDSITLSDIAGVMFNSLFLDAIEFDYERLQRVNRTVQLLSSEQKNLKYIPTLLIQPSVDLGVLASDQFKRFPKMLRYLLTGIGASQERGADLLSYIAFDKIYTEELVKIGIKDTLMREREILDFFQL